MSSVRTNKNMLFFDFKYLGKRCREYTKLPDTKPNRKKMQQVLDKIEAEITLGTFDYAKYFPGSKNAEKIAAVQSRTGVSQPTTTTPLYKEFTETWFNECQPLWRRSHIATVRSTLDKHLLPAFGDQAVSEISKADTLAFRAELAKLPGRAGNATLSAKTINRVIQIHGQILEEASDRFGFPNHVSKIKRIKQKRVDIHPFTLSEVNQIISAVRADYRQFMIVRFFTGMRTGEILGLQWKYVDFERRQILIRETLVRGEMEYTKTDGSQREIDMSQPVFDALKAQHAATGDLSSFVFCSQAGEAIDLDNFTNRVWYPLLRHLNLDKRRPYQTRHTSATLWLGAGENPEWIARQMGHSDTTMLFKTYSRYVPNLTRRDGSAIDRLLTAQLYPQQPSPQ